MYDARHVANFLLDEAALNQIGLSNLAIQKIVFFSHGWLLAFHDRALVCNEFEAWKYGPVVPVLWSEFKKFGNKVITDRATFVNPLTGARSLKPYEIAAGDKKFIRVLLKYYSAFRPEDLSEISHEAGMPWRIVREKMADSANFGSVISDDLISGAFKSLSCAWLYDAQKTLLTHLDVNRKLSA